MLWSGDRRKACCSSLNPSSSATFSEISSMRPEPPRAWSADTVGHMSSVCRGIWEPDMERCYGERSGSASDEPSVNSLLHLGCFQADDGVDGADMGAGPPEAPGLAVAAPGVGVRPGDRMSAGIAVNVGFDESRRDAPDRDRAFDQKAVLLLDCDRKPLASRRFSSARLQGPESRQSRPRPSGRAWRAPLSQSDAEPRSACRPPPASERPPKAPYSGEVSVSLLDRLRFR